ncbi:MAG: peptide ABC transporter substrate-binding protein [Candidatus Schekmanbacteria bacterium]|nr:MAG: peptide ABC transporter substrate-binding protein [Candidatus Schekmanbacteria bacterium]
MNFFFYKEKDCSLKKRFKASLYKFISILLLPSSLFFSCSRSEDFTQKRILKVSVSSEPPTLDWNLATDNVSFTIINNLMEGLTKFDERMNLIPALAWKWESNDTFTKFRFYIKDDACWSDGKAVRAQDFVYSWRRLLSPQTAAEYAYFLYDIKNAADYNSGKISNPNLLGVRAISDKVLEVELESPLSFFPYLTAFMVTFPMREDLVKKYGDKWAEAGKMEVTGPYLLSKWEHDYKIILKKNPQYKSEEMGFDEVVLFIVNQPNTALLLYETGILDVANVPSIAVSKMKKRKDFISFPIYRGYYYGFNTRKFPFDNTLVRKAIAYAIDKREIVNALRGNEIPTNSWIPPGMLGYNKNIGISFDPEKARKLLAEAGFPKGKGFPQVAISFNSSPENLIVAENIQAQLSKNLNIRVTLDNLEWKVYLGRLKKGAPPIFRLGWGADFPDPDNFMRLFTSSSGNNNTGWENKRYDELVEMAVLTDDISVRKKIYDEAQKILCEEDVPIIPLFTGTKNLLVRPTLSTKGFNPLDIFYFNRLKKR